MMKLFTIIMIIGAGTLHRSWHTEAALNTVTTVFKYEEIFEAVGGFKRQLMDVK